MPKDYIEVSLVTANVGSLFDKPGLRDNWIKCLVESVVNDENKPTFLALHLQQVGGKSFVTAATEVRHFVNLLYDAFFALGFKTLVAFVDPVSDPSKCTGLGSLYFVHESVAKEITIWDFNLFIDKKVSGYKVYHEDDLDKVSTVQQHRFHECVNPRGKADRTGYLRTRWRLHPKQDPIELLNVSLGHDESNFIAMQKFPSYYTNNRMCALGFTFRWIGAPNKSDPLVESVKDRVAFFIFGDFNFRLDTGAVVSWLREGTMLEEIKDNRNTLIRQVIHQRPQSGSDTEFGPIELTIEEKLFKVNPPHFHAPIICPKYCIRCEWIQEKLRSHDKELKLFNEEKQLDELLELDIGFPPSYCYLEDPEKGSEFGETRCPAWCDRVLFNDVAKKLFYEVLSYDMIGKHVCMGEHKPVVLRIRIGKDGKKAPKTKSKKSDKKDDQIKFCGQS